jgi:GT2 family glycosyltransferase
MKVIEYFRFSIISLNYNGRKILGDLLDAHLRSLLSSEYDDFELIFVDNGSTDGSVEYVKTHFNNKRLKIVQLQKNYGYARGNNLALEFVDPNTDIVVFINNDTIVTKDWLKHLAEAFNDTKVGIAQPLILNMNTDLIQFLGGYVDQFGRVMYTECNDEIMNTLFLTIIKILRFQPLRVLWAYGACIAIRKDLLNKIGGFNELFRFGYEEQTLCIPANALGYKVVMVPKARLYHKGRATVKHLHLLKEYYEMHIYSYLFTIHFICCLEVYLAEVC